MQTTTSSRKGVSNTDSKLVTKENYDGYQMHIRNLQLNLSQSNTKPSESKIYDSVNLLGNKAIKLSENVSETRKVETEQKVNQ